MASTAVKWVIGDIDGVKVWRPERHEDKRGWLSEIFRSDDPRCGSGPVMGYVSVTRAGAARGPHAHAEQTDLFAFTEKGQFLLKMWDARPDSPTYGNRTSMAVGGDNPAVVVVPAGIVHGYRNLSHTDGLVLNFQDRLYAGKGRKEPVDEVRYENESPQLFSMEDDREQ
jgi:dTDP-4-dehydrorhamnose 3,5-epimerase